MYNIMTRIWKRTHIIFVHHRMYMGKYEGDLEQWECYAFQGTQCSTKWFAIKPKWHVDLKNEIVYDMRAQDELTNFAHFSSSLRQNTQNIECSVMEDIFLCHFSGPVEIVVNVRRFLPILSVIGSRYSSIKISTPSTGLQSCVRRASVNSFHPNLRT